MPTAMVVGGFFSSAGIWYVEEIEKGNLQKVGGLGKGEFGGEEWDGAAAC